MFDICQQSKKEMIDFIPLTNIRHSNKTMGKNINEHYGVAKETLIFTFKELNNLQK